MHIKAWETTRNVPPPHVYPAVVMETTFIWQALSRKCLPDKTNKSTPFVVGCMRAGVKEVSKPFTV